MAAKLVNFAQWALKTSKPCAERFWYYGKVELAPPKLSEIPIGIKGILGIVNSAKSGKWKKLTVKEAIQNLIVAAEVGGWFFIGECIGKRHLIGYKLKN